MLELPNKKLSPDKPFLCNIIVGFEPQLEALIPMRQGKPLPKRTEGFFQIFGVRSGEGITPLPHRVDMWRKEKEGLAKVGRGNEYVIILEYSNRDELAATSSVIGVTPAAIKMSHTKEPFLIKSATGHVREKPMNLVSTIECVSLRARLRLFLSANLDFGFVQALQQYHTT